MQAPRGSVAALKPLCGQRQLALPAPHRCVPGGQGLGSLRTAPSSTPTAHAPAWPSQGMLEAPTPVLK